MESDQKFSNSFVQIPDEHFWGISLHIQYGIRIFLKAQIVLEMFLPTRNFLTPHA